MTIVRSLWATISVALSEKAAGLEGYAGYILHLNASFESIAREIRNKTIRVVIDPNQFKGLKSPVAIYAEVMGTVYRKEDSNQRGSGRRLFLSR